MSGGPESKGRAEDGLPWPDEATPASVTAFHAVAAAFARTKPWAVASDGQILELRLPALGWDRGYASILGHAGQKIGLLLFQSLADFVSFTRMTESDATAAGSGGVALLGVSFDDPHDVPGGAALAERARGLGWNPDPAAPRLPYLLKLSAEHLPQTLTTEDYVRATACLEAVRAFFEQHRRVFREPPADPVERELTVATTSGPIAVGVTAPPTGLPWSWGRERPREGLRRRDLEALLDGFAVAERERGADDAALAQALAHAREALRFRANRPGPLERWTAEDVHEYLLDYYPAKGGVADEAVELVPAHLDAFLDWLTISGRAAPRALRPAQDRIARCREAFLRYANDPQRFSASKVLLRAAKADGVDLDDSAAVDAFLKRFRKRLAKDPSLLPRSQGPLQRKAWIWTPDQPAPDPKGPCPCGSGRRYRRCCMPR